MRKILFLIASAYVLMFFSEYYFVNEEPAFELVGQLVNNPTGMVFLVEFVLLYVFFALAMFMAIDRFQVNDIWGLFLAGGLFGWWTEGIIIPLMYEAVPFSIVWPSLGWHAIVDVLIGWYFVRKVIHKNCWYYTLALSLVLGGFWGVWASWYYVDGMAVIEPVEFAYYAVFTGGLLVLAYGVMDWSNVRSIGFRPWMRWLYGVISMLLVIVMTVYYTWLAGLVFVPLVVLTLWLLSKGSKGSAMDYQLDKVTVSFIQYVLLLLIPIISSVTYSLVYASELAMVVGELVPGALMVAGFVGYIVAGFVKVRRVDELRLE